MSENANNDKRNGFLVLGGILALIFLVCMVAPSGRAPGSSSSTEGMRLYARVISNTGWSGYFGDHSVDGYESRDIEFKGEQGTCANVQNKTDRGYVSLMFYAVDASGAVIWRSDTTTTTASYGVVSKCARP